MEITVRKNEKSKPKFLVKTAIVLFLGFLSIWFAGRNQGNKAVPTALSAKHSAFPKQVASKNLNAELQKLGRLRQELNASLAEENSQAKAISQDEDISTEEREKMENQLREEIAIQEEKERIRASQREEQVKLLESMQEELVLEKTRGIMPSWVMEEGMSEANKEKD